MLVSILFMLSFKADSNEEKFPKPECPSVSFTISNNGCTAACTISFANTSTNATSYHWDFGDGNTSTEKDPQHTYQEAGTYNVELTGFLDGCEHSFIGTVEVVEG